MFLEYKIHNLEGENATLAREKLIMQFRNGIIADI